MKRKKQIIFIIIIALITTGTGIFYSTKKKTQQDETITSFETPIMNESKNSEQIENNPVSLELVSGPEVLPSDPKGTEGFVGILEGIDTGCFADAECFAVVDGKKIIVLVGGRGNQNEPVGEVRGFESFAALFNYIGGFVEVKAMKIDDENYTLYGSPGYFIKLF